jgi:hypothetical protein
MFDIDVLDKDLSVSSEVWNISGGFTRFKILRQMVKLDIYEDIATHGVEELDQKVGLTQNDINRRRFEGLQRFISTLNQLVGNVFFIIRIEDGLMLDAYKKRIAVVEKFLDGCIKINENLITHEVNYEINEKHFQNCFSAIKSIKDSVNIIINNAGVIFRKSDDVDMNQLMQDVVDGG